jgi:hypothetical protein
MKAHRAQLLALMNGHPSQKRARFSTTAAAQHRCPIVAALTVGAITVVFVPIRGRFRVNITAPIVIRMTTTGYIAGIAIDLLYS